MKILSQDVIKRNFGLDILRAIAIITVVYNHGVIYGGEIIGRSKYDWFHFDGVSLFFVLSGFLIGGILFKILNKPGGNSLKNLSDFWIRRWFRTLPLYYLVLLVVFFREVYITGGVQWYQLKYFLFLQNFISFKYEFFLESWSLAVEEWFYLLIPAFLFLIIGAIEKSLKQACIFLVIACVIFCLFARTIYFIHYKNVLIETHVMSNRFPFTVICRMDSIMAGILFAYFSFTKSNMWNWFKQKWVLLLLLLIIIADYILYNYNVFLTADGTVSLMFYRHVIHYTLLPWACAALLPFFTSITARNGLIPSFITLVSLISYSMYLLHLQVIVKFGINEKIVDWVTGNPSRFTMHSYYVCYWIITILLSIVTYKYFEVPVMNLREKFARA